MAGYGIAAAGRKVRCRTIGGFAGGDNSPTLQQFQQYVADGQIRYFIIGNGPGGGHRGPGGESGTAPAITQWVKQHFTAQNIGGTDVYDLTRGR